MTPLRLPSPGKLPSLQSPQKSATEPVRAHGCPSLESMLPASSPAALIKGCHGNPAGKANAEQEDEPSSRPHSPRWEHQGSSLGHVLVDIKVTDKSESK